METALRRIDDRDLTDWSNDMTEQPNKPGGDFDENGDPRKAGDRQAVRNQSVVSPEDYPEPAAGETEKPSPA